MHARVATFDGGEADQVREMFEQIKSRGESGPPEGVPAVGLLMLHQPEQGRVLAISLFETEEDLEQGDATLSAMDPPTPGGLGSRTSIERYEVGVKFDA